MARGFLTTVVVTGPFQFFVNAPFGRFTPDSKWTVDGIRAWIVMELVSPLCLLASFLKHPLSRATPPLRSPAGLLTGLFVAHYTNRALISPLRTPVRSRAHVVIPLSAMAFNTLNGSLMGSFLSSSVPSDLWSTNAWFWPGVALWFAGFVGNIVHDEILINLRRTTPHGPDGKPRYAVPYGFLYKWVSYPNYLCEWLEWLGFALAACPTPRSTAAPWIFFVAEVCTMLPRAVKGHKWYHEKFPDYPRERAAVIPFVL